MFNLVSSIKKSLQLMRSVRYAVRPYCYLLCRSSWHLKVERNVYIFILSKYVNLLLNYVFSSVGVAMGYGMDG
jgi:hypothetical protein